MQFLHCADIHLDSPLRGLERYEGAPVDEVRGATRRAFRNLIDAALRERVDFVVIAGDLYDGNWPDFNTGLFFAKGMAELGESGIAVYGVRGNHDATSQITRTLRQPKNVHFLPDLAPSTLTNDDLGLAVHGQSFATPVVLTDLAAGYPGAVPGLFNLGILHTALTGRAGHDPYAPTNEAVLRTKGYDYWALGHVHAREIVTREPWVVYPGNLQGRHIREAGVKGCELVSVVDGHIATTPLALDVLRWRELAVDVTGLANLDALLDHVTTAVRTARTQADGRILGLRLQLYGVSPLQAQLSARAAMVAEELRACVVAAGNGEVWLEKIQNVVRPTLDLARLASGNDPVGLLLQELAQLATNPAELAALSSEVLADLVSKLPTEADDRDAFRVNNPALLQDLLAQAQAELLDALAGAGGAP